VLRVATIDQAGLQLLSLEPEAAAAALRRGDIDGTIFVAKIDAPVVRQLHTGQGHRTAPAQGRAELSRW
jgi:ABC-type taurine transport system substrate-binding protein